MRVRAFEHRVQLVAQILNAMGSMLRLKMGKAIERTKRWCTQKWRRLSVKAEVAACALRGMEMVGMQSEKSIPMGKAVPQSLVQVAVLEEALHQEAYPDGPYSHGCD